MHCPREGAASVQVFALELPSVITTEFVVIEEVIAVGMSRSRFHLAQACTEHAWRKLWTEHASGSGRINQIVASRDQSCPHWKRTQPSSAASHKPVNTDQLGSPSQPRKDQLGSPSHGRSADGCLFVFTKHLFHWEVALHTEFSINQPATTEVDGGCSEQVFHRDEQNWIARKEELFKKILDFFILIEKNDFFNVNFDKKIWFFD